MNIFTNLLSVLLACVLLISLFSCATSPKDEQGSDDKTTQTTQNSQNTTAPDEIAPEPIVYSEGLEFMLNSDSTGYVVKGIGACTDTELMIPNEYQGLPVVEIGEKAFMNCSALTSVTVPDSVTRIGKFAFSNCTSITSIKLPFVGAEEGADEMSTRKFGYIFGEGSNQSALPTSLKTVEITKATSIPDSAFLGCDKLTSVVLHESVTSIETMAFYGCKNLTNIEIRGDLTFIGMESFFGCLALKKIVIPKSVIYIDNNAFEGNQLTIYCEISSQPATWHKDWNRFNLTVVWGYTGDKS